jgi:hypothetical protein
MVRGSLLVAVERPLVLHVCCVSGTVSLPFPPVGLQSLADCDCSVCFRFRPWFQTSEVDTSRKCCRFHVSDRLPLWCEPLIFSPPTWNSLCFGQCGGPTSSFAAVDISARKTPALAFCHSVLEFHAVCGPAPGVSTMIWSIVLHIFE